MATKNNPGAWDCYANAHPDEPMFILLGRDKHAPILVHLWSLLRELDGEDPAKIAEAHKCLRDMLAWLRDLGKAPAHRGVLMHALAVDTIRLERIATRMFSSHSTEEADVTGALEIMRAFDNAPPREVINAAPTSEYHRLAGIAAIIEAVDQRCLAADGSVTPTRCEITGDELRQIYKLAKGES